MEISLSTFILEIINFLVLVWILKRFLYRPVLDIVARRQAGIDATMAEAKRTDSEARQLKERYEARLRDWETEQAEAREQLSHELDEERGRRLAELRTSLDEEAEKRRAAEERRLADLGARLEKQSLALGGRFASRLLEASATPELQQKLVELFLEDLEATPRDRVACLTGSPDLPPDGIDVSSAYGLTPDEQEAVSEQARKFFGTDVPVRFAEDASLVAGLRLTVGGCVLGLNLKDELDGFARLRDAAD
jgi:F-type H+-transporting ATPase subunit b